MSRGYGRVQREILVSLTEFQKMHGNKLVPTYLLVPKNATRAQKESFHRALRKLAAEGAIEYRNRKGGDNGLRTEFKDGRWVRYFGEPARRFGFVRLLTPVET